MDLLFEKVTTKNSRKKLRNQLFFQCPDNSCQTVFENERKNNSPEFLARKYLIRRKISIKGPTDIIPSLSFLQWTQQVNEMHSKLFALFIVVILAAFISDTYAAPANQSIELVLAGGKFILNLNKLYKKYILLIQRSRCTASRGRTFGRRSSS